MMESSFWGVILKSEKRYEQVVEKSFHVSKAAMEPGSSGKVTSVYLEVDNHDEFILCNLSDKNLNETLDLNFMEGEKICFKTTGGGSIHLTGYLLPDSDIDESYVMGSEAEEASSSEEEESILEEEPPQLVNGKSKKRKKESLETALSSGDTPSKKKKITNGIDIEKEKDLKKAQFMKKKIAEIASSKKVVSDDANDSEDDDEDDESSDDGIMDYTDNYAEENDSPESEDDDDEGESEDDDDDSENDDDDDDEEEEKEEIKSTPKVNGKNVQKNNGISTPQTPKEKKKNDETPSSKKALKDKTPNKNNSINENGDSGKKTPKTKTPVRTIKGGIKIEDLKVGTGPEAKRGKMLGMYYDGRLKSNNKRFDATLSGKPFKFRLGTGEVIKGWDLGLEGIKVGGKRRLTLPPNMAYGSQGAPPDIPPNSALVFEVECKHVN